ncbi:tetratricopeptide repeat protein, partial [Streptomyces sp. SP17KL33]|uniref:tetratricopeptide repeat protein n=1 Tax=Streptomyces sp. SP17KL33 TaxID=3002534 RepID=UPI002E7638FB
ARHRATALLRTALPGEPDTNVAGWQAWRVLLPHAEALLADRVRVLGEDHPDTFASRNNLADAYQAGGDHGRAVPLNEQTLADR